MDSTPEAEARLVDTFLDLVRIDSPSGEEAAFAMWCADLLRDIGFDVRFDDAAETAGSDTGNVIAFLPGTCVGRSLVLSAHLDTVEPGRGIEPVIVDGVVHAAGDTVLGADDKAGVAVIIECARRLLARGEPRPDLRVLLTVNEENGLRGAKALDAADVTGDLCLVLDADGVPGGIVNAAPTHYTFTATFTGRAAHAGVEPEKGVSAVLMAAKAIAAMPAGRLDERTTANVGTVGGGCRTNVIAPTCTITGECRSLDRDRVESVRADMQETMDAVANEEGGEVAVVWTLEYEGYSIDDDDPSLALVTGACRDAGIEPRLFATGGGSDGNVLTRKGVTTLVLASGMREVHGMGEHIAVADLEALCRLVVTVAGRTCA